LLASDGERHARFVDAVGKSMRAIRATSGAASIDPALLTTGE
jgi:hypothetical protein